MRAKLRVALRAKLRVELRVNLRVKLREKREGSLKKVKVENHPKVTVEDFVQLGAEIMSRLPYIKDLKSFEDWWTAHFEVHLMVVWQIWQLL